MNALINTNMEFKSNVLRKKPSFRLDGSYRIFHITKRQKEESDDDDDHHHNTHTISKERDIKTRHHKKSFRLSDRHGFEGWKRKSTKNKRLLFLHKTSCESTSNEAKTPPSPRRLTNDLSQSIISNNAASNQLLKQEKNTGESLFESDVLVEDIHETIDHDNVTLNNLLARADQLETSVKKQEFNKIHRIPRTSIQRKRKRFIIICSTILIILTIVVTIILFTLIIVLRYKTYKNQVSKSLIKKKKTK
ncbi:unnamed protein product [Adineta steineri]|uniref:Uncharacterized protein n=1 Tax=Adineta steineri TaxID=433720 RepID=A0A813MJZ3_9BILA|nr:unnamed protein product [Adineta steineri]